MHVQFSRINFLESTCVSRHLERAVEYVRSRNWPAPLRTNLIHEDSRRLFRLVLLALARNILSAGRRHARLVQALCRRLRHGRTQRSVLQVAATGDGERVE